MKISIKAKSNKQTLRKRINDDYRYLQKKISGRSVYKNILATYKRTPKHKGKQLDLHFQ